MVVVGKSQTRQLRNSWRAIPQTLRQATLKLRLSQLPPATPQITYNDYLSTIPCTLIAQVNNLQSWLLDHTARPTRFLDDVSQPADSWEKRSHANFASSILVSSSVRSSRPLSTSLLLCSSLWYPLLTRDTATPNSRLSVNMVYETSERSGVSSLLCPRFDVLLGGNIVIQLQK